MQTETTDSYFLSKRSAEKDLLKRAEEESDRILHELKGFFSGNISICVYAVYHVEGVSIAGDLMVNDDICRSYDPVDLCFLELNELMLKRLVQARRKSR